MLPLDSCDSVKTHCPQSRYYSTLGLCFTDLSCSLRHLVSSASTHQTTTIRCLASAIHGNSPQHSACRTIVASSDCAPHTPSSMFSSTGIWERLSMSGYSPMERVTSSITSLLLILLFLLPFRSDWAIKRITPKGISNRGFKSTPTSCEVGTREVAILLYIIFH